MSNNFYHNNNNNSTSLPSINPTSSDSTSSSSPLPPSSASPRNVNHNHNSNNTNQCNTLFRDVLVFVVLLVGVVVAMFAMAEFDVILRKYYLLDGNNNNNQNGGETTSSDKMSNNSNNNNLSSSHGVHKKPPPHYMLNPNFGNDHEDVVRLHLLHLDLFQQKKRLDELRKHKHDPTAKSTSANHHNNHNKINPTTSRPIGADAAATLSAAERLVKERHDRDDPEYEDDDFIEFRPVHPEFRTEWIAKVNPHAEEATKKRYAAWDRTHPIPVLSTCSHIRRSLEKKRLIDEIQKQQEKIEAEERELKNKKNLRDGSRRLRNDDGNSNDDDDDEDEKFDSDLDEIKKKRLINHNHNVKNKNKSNKNNDDEEKVKEKQQDKNIHHVNKNNNTKMNSSFNDDDDNDGDDELLFPHSFTLDEQQSLKKPFTLNNTVLQPVFFSNPRPKIALLTMHSVQVTSDSSSTRRLVQHASLLPLMFYCKKHRYDLIVEDHDIVDPRRPPAWSKVRALRKWLPHYEWVIWLDMDVIITNFHYDFESFIRHRENIVMRDNEQKHKDAQELYLKNKLQGGKVAHGIGNFSAPTPRPLPQIIIGNDWNGINSGITLWRNSTFTQGFLKRMWGVPKELAQPFWDQGAMKYLLYRGLRGRDEKAADYDFARLDITDELNRYPVGLLMWGKNIDKVAWKDGDWLVHFASCKYFDTCVRWMNYFSSYVGCAFGSPIWGENVTIAKPFYRTDFLPGVVVAAPDLNEPLEPYPTQMRQYQFHNPRKYVFRNVVDSNENEKGKKNHNNNSNSSSSSLSSSDSDHHPFLKNSAAKIRLEKLKKQLAKLQQEKEI